MSKNIKTATFNNGTSAEYDDDVLQDRVKYAMATMAKVKSGEITPQEGTKRLNEFGKANKHWL